MRDAEKHVIRRHAPSCLQVGGYPAPARAKCGSGAELTSFDTSLAVSFVGHERMAWVAFTVCTEA